MLYTADGWLNAIVPLLIFLASFTQPWISEGDKRLNLAIGRAHLGLLQLSCFLNLQKKAEELWGAALSNAPISAISAIFILAQLKEDYYDSVKYKI